MKVLCIFHQRKTLSFKSVRLVSISKDGFTYFLEKNLFLFNTNILLIFVAIHNSRYLQSNGNVNLIKYIDR